MKISKHIHSCLLIKEEEKVILIDPGSYCVEDKGININDIEKLDYLLITHEHTDHFYMPFVKDLVTKFPSLKIISNQSVSDKLSAEDIRADTKGDELIETADAPHEHIFGGIQFQNTLFHISSRLTHPGDNLHFEKSCQILALPVQAPWGSLTQAVEKAIEVKPEYIIPIHDWHWSEKAREDFYTRLENYFGQFGIKFLGLKTKEEVEI